jgi:hypothetical protein
MTPNLEAIAERRLGMSRRISDLDHPYRTFRPLLLLCAALALIDAALMLWLILE